MNKNDGGPIFPVTFKAPGPDGPASGPQCVLTGMSVRDWFAGQIIPALIISDPNCAAEELAYKAYQRADAMLEKRR